MRVSTVANSEREREREHEVGNKRLAHLPVHHRRRLSEYVLGCLRPLQSFQVSSLIYLYPKKEARLTTTTWVGWRRGTFARRQRTNHHPGNQLTSQPARRCYRLLSCSNCVPIPHPASSTHRQRPIQPLLCFLLSFGTGTPLRCWRALCTT